MSNRLPSPLDARTSRRTLLAAAAVAAPALGLAGRVGPAAAQDKPTITMWFDTTNGVETANCMVEDVIGPYGETGTAVVEPTLQANNWDAVRTALAGGEGPDLVGTPGPTFAFELAKAWPAAGARRVRRQ
jgi:ABC-type glycerol-3-phosphate transport system substrate-binding protein